MGVRVTNLNATMFPAPTGWTLSCADRPLELIGRVDENSGH